MIFKKKVPVPGKNYRSDGRWMEEGTGRGGEKWLNVVGRKK